MSQLTGETKPTGGRLSWKKKIPDCGNLLEGKDVVARSVMESVPVKAEKVLYKCERKWCKHCKKIIRKKPEVLPRSLYGNQLIANTATMHYVHGIPMRRIERMLGENISSGLIPYSASMPMG